MHLRSLVLSKLGRRYKAIIIDFKFYETVVHLIECFIVPRGGIAVVARFENAVKEPVLGGPVGRATAISSTHVGLPFCKP